MANWKLRKDKTPTGTPDAAPETLDAAPELPPFDTNDESSSSEQDEALEPVSLDSIPLQPAFEPETSFTGLNFDRDPEEPEAAEPELKEPEADAPAHSAFSQHGAQIFEMPPPEIETPADDFKMPADDFDMPLPAVEMPDAIAMPPFDTEDVPTAEAEPVEEGFPEMLRTGRFEAGELAPAPEFGFGIPTVSPFVLDTPPPAAPAAAPPQLVVRVGRLSAPFPLVKDVTTVGRPDSSLHYYPDVEVEMDDAVSRRHAEVVKREGDYYLVDTGSTNGTLLNGERLPAHEERLLTYGDRIKIGDRTEVTFE